MAAEHVSSLRGDWLSADGVARNRKFESGSPQRRVQRTIGSAAISERHQATASAASAGNRALTCPTSSSPRVASRRGRIVFCLVAALHHVVELHCLAAHGYPRQLRAHEDLVLRRHHAWFIERPGLDDQIVGAAQLQRMGYARAADRAKTSVDPPAGGAYGAVGS